MMRILSRLNPHAPAGVVLPKEILTFEAGTLSAKVPPFFFFFVLFHFRLFQP